MQLDLFPFQVEVEALDPRAAIGARTGVEHLFRVRVNAGEAPHLVYHDRHGWYCEVHGKGCTAVGAVLRILPGHPAEGSLERGRR